MKLEYYEGLSATLLDAAAEIERAKRPSYTIGSEDVLANFKRVAERVGVTPGQALAVYMLKHVDAVTAALTNPAIPQAEEITGRFADLLNYTKLGYALVKEREAPDSVELHERLHVQAQRTLADGSLCTYVSAG